MCSASATKGDFPFIILRKLEYVISIIGTASTKNGNNIASVADQDGNIESYTYDSLNQLSTVTRGSDVYAYTYDNGGNILSVSKNGTVEKTYTYGNSGWKDLLTAYNGTGISYDAIGNPLNLCSAL